MKTIFWQEKTPLLHESFLKGHLLPGANGGNSYDFHAIRSLSGEFNASVDPYTIKLPAEGFLLYYLRQSNYRCKSDVVVKASYPLVFGPSKEFAKRIAVIHHIDEMIEGRSFMHKWFFRKLRKRLRRADLVVTVSEYWKNYLEKHDCRNVRVIYNSFQVEEYTSEAGSSEHFRKEYGFSTDQPLVHIGNAHPGKGVREVYHALRNSGVQMVMTGPSNRVPGLPVRFLSLPHREYVSLLGACDAVIAFSSLGEGWNRIAHEAMLAGTPVIGSGSGGMKELLEGGKQVICSLDELPQKLNEVLADRARYSEPGLGFVRRYDMNYFRTEWIDAVNSVLG